MVPLKIGVGTCKTIMGFLARTMVAKIQKNRYMIQQYQIICGGVLKCWYPQSSSISIEFSIINPPFWDTPIYGNLHEMIHDILFDLCTSSYTMAPVFLTSTSLGILLCPHLALCYLGVSQNGGTP